MSNIPSEADPFVAERIAQIRDRFGTKGLRDAIDLAAAEIAIFEGEAAGIRDDGPEVPQR